MPQSGFYNLNVSDGCTTKTMVVDMTACVSCSDDAGTLATSLSSGSASINPLYLCFGDSLDLAHNGDQDLAGDPDPSTTSGVQYAIYTCLPTATGPTLNDIVLDPGIFRVRGDVVDIFPIYDDNPIRIEFFGDEIEKISEFNLITGEIIKEFDQITFYPCKNFVTTRETLNNGIEKIRDELGPRLKFLRKNGMLLEAQRLEQRTLYDIEMMMELGYCSGIENYSRHLDGRKEGKRPFCLLDFF